MMLQHRDATQRQQRDAAFVAGAKQGVVNMTSLDFNKAKEDVQRVIDSSTGEFKDDFQQRADDFIAVVAQSKMVTEGTVNAAAIESMDREFGGGFGLGDIADHQFPSREGRTTTDMAAQSDRDRSRRAVQDVES